MAVASVLAVLDTNVWLDWLVFDDPCVIPLKAAQARGQLSLHATARMGAELEDVLARERLARWSPDAASCLAIWLQLNALHDPAPSVPLVCSDPDDQCFLDLAVQLQAQWLVTKDRALLKLARRAWQDHSLRIVRPEGVSL